MPKDTHETALTQFAEAGGIRFACWHFGRRGGIPLLLLGYFSANLDRWDPKVTNGFAAEREVILVDYPGIGGAPGMPASRAAQGRRSCVAILPAGIWEAASATARQPERRARITSSSRLQIKSGCRGTSGSFSRRSSSSSLLVR
jgi:hypothetical protein